MHSHSQPALVAHTSPTTASPLLRHSHPHYYQPASAAVLSSSLKPTPVALPSSIPSPPWQQTYSFSLQAPSIGILIFILLLHCIAHQVPPLHPRRAMLHLHDYITTTLYISIALTGKNEPTGKHQIRSGYRIITDSSRHLPPPPGRACASLTAMR